MADKCGPHCNPKFSNGWCMDGFGCKDHHCQCEECHG